MTTRNAVGIDLGTTYSAISYLDKHGKPHSIPNLDGDFNTPSCILFDDDITIGKHALKNCTVNPDAYAESFKRDIGSRFYQRKILKQSVPPSILSALIISQLKKDAVREIGSLNSAVITVPAFFDEARRKATKTAMELAGLECMGIINEPTAAAIYYAQQGGLIDPENDSPINIMIYDLGGGTFDVSIVRLTGTKFLTLATDGDVRLGGKDFDQRMVDFVANQFRQKHNIDPRQNPADCAKLWLDCEEAKRSLSTRNEVSIVCHHEGLRETCKITRDEFEDLTNDLLGRTEITTELCLIEAGIIWDDIHCIVPVGGSSRMPMVAEMLRKLSATSVEVTNAMDFAVVHGAAIYCGLLNDYRPKDMISEISVSDVCSHGFGVIGFEKSTGQRRVGEVIPKNTKLPCVITKRFSTATTGQPNVIVDIVEGDSKIPSQCIPIGRCTISDLPPNLPAGTPLDLSFKCTVDGTLVCTAKLPSIRRVAQTTIDRQHSLPSESLASWLDRFLHEDDSDHDRTGFYLSNLSSLSLDQLYLQVATEARQIPIKASHLTKASELEKQIAVAKRDLSELEEQVDSVSSIERITHSSLIAQKRNSIAVLEKNLEAIWVSYGQHCYENDMTFTGCELYYDQIEKIVR